MDFFYERAHFVQLCVRHLCLQWKPIQQKQSSECPRSPHSEPHSERISEITWVRCSLYLLFHLAWSLVTAAAHVTDLVADGLCADTPWHRFQTPPPE